MNDHGESAQEVLASTVKDKRSKLKMNRGVFAEHAGVSVECVIRIEHGEIDFKNLDHVRVLNVLGLNMKTETLPSTKRKKWTRFKLHSNFPSRTRKLPHRRIRESLHR